MCWQHERKQQTGIGIQEIGGLQLSVEGGAGDRRGILGSRL